MSAIAEVSASVYLTAALVWAFGSGGAMLAATFGIVAMLPAAVVAPFAAVISDRVPKERVIVVALAARGALLLLLAVGVAAGSTAAVLLAAMAASICARVLYPALGALIPTLARGRDELVAANSLVSGIENVGFVAGPAIAGAALIVVSPAVVCAVAACGTVVAALVAVGLRGADDSDVEPSEPERTSPGREIAAGFTSIAADPLTRGIVAISAVHCFAFGALGVVIVQLAVHDLALGAPGLGLLETALAVGGIGGGGVALACGAAQSPTSSIRHGGLLWAAALAAAAVGAGPVDVVIGLAAAGVGNILIDVATYTHVQEATSQAVLARTIAAMQSIGVAAIGLGNFAAGVALGLLGTRPTLALLAACVPVAAFTLARRPSTVVPTVAAAAGAEPQPFARST